MINLIMSEIYRVLQKRSLLVFGLIIFLADFCVIMFFNEINTVGSIEAVITENVLLGSGIILYTFYPIDAIWIDEFRNKTIKNTLSYGINKKVIFISKTIATVLITLAFNIAESIYCIFIQAFIYSNNGNLHGEFFWNLLIKFLTSIPLIGAVTLFCIIITLLVKKLFLVILICGSNFIFVENSEFMILIKNNSVVDFIYRILPNTNLNLILWGSKYGGQISIGALNITDMGIYIILGMIYIIIFGYIGYIIYDKIVI